MSELYLLSAPILLLGIVALLRFVGCSFHPGMASPTAPVLGAPVVGNGQVTLTWTESDTGTTGYSYQVNRSGGAPPTILGPVTDTMYTDVGLTNGTTYTYSVTVVFGGTAYGTSNSVNATPAVLPGRPPGAVWDPMNPLSANLIGLFIMNEGTETDEGKPAQDINLVDMTTANPAGGAPPSWEVADPSIVFHGGPSLNSYLDAGVDLLFNDMPTSMITIVAKVFATGLIAGGICEKNDGKPPNSDSGFIFAMNNSGALRVTVELTTNSMRITTNPVVVVGQWMQLAFTWDGTQYNVGTMTAPAAAATVYVNQVAQPNATATDGHGTLDATRLSNNQPFRIGNVSYDLAGSFYGKIAYMAVYKGRLLTTTEMATLDSSPPIKSASS